MKKISNLFLLAAFCVLANYHSSLAQNTLSTTQLNIFKNGTYFIVKEGNVTAPNAKWTMYPPASPLLATFWLTGTKDIKITRIDFVNDTVKTKLQASNLQEEMIFNKGKKVSITYTFGDKQIKTVTGTLVNMIGGGQTAAVKDAVTGATTFINTSSMVDFTVNEATIDTKPWDSTFRVAKVFFNHAAENTPLKLSYMSTGMTWLPSYNIKLIDEKTLQLEMKALIENYSEKIDNVEITLTVGSPQFKYGQQIDPLAGNYLTYGNANNYTWNYPAYDNYLANGASQSIYSNGTSTADYEWSSDPSSYGGTPSYNDYSNYTTEGDKSNDLYMYKIGKVSLPINTKSSFSIFSATIPYEEIYEVGLNDIVNYASNRTIGNDEEQKFDVYHSLKLNNNTTYPFTTAPVFVQDEKLQPLAQDQIKYTPVASKVKVQLARSPDVIVKNTEEETGKTDNVKKYNSYYYSLVTIKGTIPVENLQSKEITLNITKHLNADVSVASDEGTIKKSGKYSGLNPFSTVEWNVKLAPGEKKSVTYEYKVYVYGTN